MDNIIKIILRQSGGLAEMVKTIPLYVGMYNTAILDVYVPQNLVSEGISVKVGAILTANDGTKATTDSIPMTYKGEETFCNEQYTVYELNPFPANFLTYAGQQDLVVNIVTIENEEVASVVTTQICKVDVLDSALIPDEELSTSAVDQFNARITANEQNIATNTENITANTGQIEQNTQDISSNTQRISDLEQSISVGENYVGSLTVDTLVGIDIRLNQLVQQVESRQPKNGDVVMVTLQITGQTDEIYKYYYTAGGWGNYKMPSIESASNTDKGIIKGTLGENKNTQVDISGGEINAIYVKDNSNVLRDIREYANTTKTSIANIISGQTKVGYAQKADEDGLGNNIQNTYMSQNAGVTKTQMREYALPREFNDIFYLNKGSLNEATLTSTKPTQPLTFGYIGSSIGTYPIISPYYLSTAEFELSKKNSYQAVFYVSVDVGTTVQFRLDLVGGGSPIILNTELSNEMVMSANTIYKLQFNGNFNEIEDVYKFGGIDQLQVVLSVVSTSTTTVQYTVYQNSTYISTFNLNTNKYVITTQTGELGEIPRIVVDGYEIESGTISFQMYEDMLPLKNNVLVSFKLSYNGTDLNKYVKLVREFSSSQDEEYHLKTPYNTDAFNDRPTVNDFKQTSVTTTNGVTTIEFIGLVQIIEGYGTEIIVNEDNLADKLDKSNGWNKIYATDVHGDQIMLGYGVYGSGDYSVVIRKTDGSIEVHTPQNINDATNKEYVDNKVDFIKSDVVSGLDWATFNTSNFNTIFGTGWDAQLGNYGCRANTSDDTSGTASGFGFSGTYYAEFKVWYVGTNNVGLIITLSDSGTKNIATANVLVDRATNTDIHSNFFSAYAEKVDKASTPLRLYGIDSNGNQDLVPFSNNASAWTIPLRDANSDVIVPATPTNDYGATSKQYVDAKMSGAVTDLFETSSSNITGTITDITNFKFIEILFKNSGNRWASAVYPVTFITRELQYGLPTLLCDTNYSNTDMWVEVTINSATSISIQTYNGSYTMIRGIN